MNMMIPTQQDALTFACLARDPEQPIFLVTLFPEVRAVQICYHELIYREEIMPISMFVIYLSSWWSAS